MFARVGELYPLSTMYAVQLRPADWAVLDRATRLDGYGHVRAVYGDGSGYGHVRAVYGDGSGAEEAGPAPSLQRAMKDYRCSVSLAQFPVSSVVFTFEARDDSDAARFQLRWRLEEFISECEMFLKAYDGLTPFAQRAKQ